MKYQKLGARDCAETLAPLGERPKSAQHWPKNQAATDAPCSHELIGLAHEDAISLSAMPSRFRGGISVFSMGMLGIAAFFGLEVLPVSVSAWISELLKNGLDIFFFVGLLLNGLVALLASVSLIAALRFLRLDLFSPKEIPLVFNRAARKVYRFSPDMPSFALYGWSWQGVWLTLRQIPPYVLSTFAPSSMLLVEYDWDCLEAEYREEVMLSNNVVRTVRHLDLLVREAPGSDTLIGSFPLAPSLMVGEPMARAVWEHVRRFMDHNGPALSPGDEPAPPPPKNAWQAANALFNGPGWIFCAIGMIWTAQDIKWAVERILRTPGSNSTDHMSFMTFLIIFVSYFFGAWVFFAVVAHFTSPHVELPAEALEGAGQKIDLKAMAKQPVSISTS